MKALEVDIGRKAFPPSGAQRGHLAVENLKFSVAEGEFVCILGPSGTGKSTTLNIIAGLDKDYEGGIRFGARQDERGLAYVFQSPRLLPWRTVIENVALALNGAESDDDIAMHLLKDVGLSGFANAYPGQISLGMQRRASLARAFALQPGILLLDEPFVSLDEEAAASLRALLLKLWRARPTTVLFVTHDTREAIKLATRILVFSSAPATLLHDIPVPLAPADRDNPQAVEAFRRAASPLSHGASVLSDKAGLNGLEAGGA